MYHEDVTRSLLVLLALALASGCPHKTASPPPPEASSSDQASPPPSSDDELPPPETEPPPPEPGTCAEGGRLWDGKPGDCSYEHGGCCYDSAAAACAAAGCAADRCNVMESYPAQIACSEE